ncbi:type IV pilin N-terminal domain-containing protein [Halorhabdus rudnickae]|uniref:type IV pilin N-terminal domain-containing protein n=1 Tax=Halorhabdus rudnickae TaxID=1775544 RepID=UPI001084922D|nr:type IV pilin N-terminal domain-containing protein [Halorhabdus rudnickae]
MKPSVWSPSTRGVISILSILLMLFGAVFGSFVLGMGEASQQHAEPVPQVAVGFETDGSGTVTVTHEGGDTVHRSAIEIRSPGTTGEWNTLESDGKISAGDSITVSGLESGDTIQVVWESSDSDTSAVLATYDVP